MQIPRPIEVLDVDTVRGKHGGQLVALAVGQGAEHVDVERAHAGSRAEEAATEPGTLFIGPVDQGDGDRWCAVGGE